MDNNTSNRVNGPDQIINVVYLLDLPSRKEYNKLQIVDTYIKDAYWDGKLSVDIIFQTTDTFEHKQRIMRLVSKSGYTVTPIVDKMFFQPYITGMNVSWENVFKANVVQDFFLKDKKI